VAVGSGGVRVPICSFVYSDDERLRFLAEI
jgi:hypothetical protein